MSVHQIPADRIDQLFSAYTAPGSPGSALGIMLGGELAYSQGYGLANLEHDIPITPSTVFHVASLSKQFTGLAVALLIEAGYLSLDDEVRGYLPRVPDFGRPVTVRHLLYHTSGLRSDLILLLMAGWRLEDVITNADLMELVSRQEALNFAPGSDFAYGGTGYMLLALIVEEMTGESLDDFCQAQIFEPLGMSSTHFHDDILRLVMNRADAYYPTGVGRYQKAVLSCALTGGTGLYTTIEDLARWDRNFLTGQVGGRGAIELMHQPGALDNGQPLDYGFGVFVETYKGRPAIMHSGDGAGVHAHLIRLQNVPGQRSGADEGLSVAVLANCSAIRARVLAWQVADICLGLEKGDEAPPQVATPQDVPEAALRSELGPNGLAAYAGRYTSSELDTTWTILIKGERLAIRRPRQGWSVLEPLAADRFADKWMSALLHGALKPAILAFDRDAEGEVTGLRISDTGSRVRDIAFVKQSDC